MIEQHERDDRAMEKQMLNIKLLHRKINMYLKIIDRRSGDLKNKR